MAFGEQVKHYCDNEEKVLVKVWLSTICTRDVSSLDFNDGSSSYTGVVKNVRQKTSCHVVMTNGDGVNSFFLVFSFERPSFVTSMGLVDEDRSGSVNYHDEAIDKTCLVVVSYCIINVIYIFVPYCSYFG